VIPRLTDRTALVTGATSNIGRAIAVRLAADGFWVLLADVRRDPITGGEPTDDLIRASGGACEYLAADVSDRQDCDGLVDRAAAKAGRLDVLVNNAALAGHHSKPLLGTEDGDFDAIMAVNLRGPFMLCRAAVRQMLTQEPRGPARGPARGRIVNITSQHGMAGAPGHAAYAVSKAGLIQLTRQIAVEYGRDGIICNGVAPGKVVTGTPGDLSQSETTAAYVRSRTPFARFGEPEDVAQAAVWLASDQSDYVHGTTIYVDGGMTLYPGFIGAG